MTKRARRNHTLAFEAKLARAVVRVAKMIVELEQQFDVQPNQITQWRNQLLYGAAGAFEGEAKATAPVRQTEPALKQGACRAKMRIRAIWMTILIRAEIQHARAVLGESRKYQKISN